MRLDAPRLPVTQVTGEAELEALIGALAGLTEVSLDAERASGFRYSQRAYLIQVATADAIY